MSQPPRLAKQFAGWLILGSGFPPPQRLLTKGAEALYPIGEPEPMFQDNSQNTPNLPPADGTLPEHQYDAVNHTLLGSLIAIRNTIALLHKLNYAEPNDWSKPLPTGRPNEMMAILTKRVRVD